MQSSLPPEQRTEADREKRWVALSSFLAATLLTVLKLVIGLATNSLGILSEAAHSGFDLIAAAVTLWAVHMSSQPADRTHTYGHGKFENLSALVETLLLMGTCVWIVHESMQRLFFAEETIHVEANIAAFLVVILSIAVDFSRSRALNRVARKHDSQALEADALHFSTDVLVLGSRARGAPRCDRRPTLRSPLVAKRRFAGRLGRGGDRRLDQRPAGHEVDCGLAGRHP